MLEIGEVSEMGAVEVLLKKISLYRDAVRGRVSPADIAIFQEFAPPPGGGGNQFLRALWSEFENSGFRVENNRISRATRACLFNSYNFDFDRLRYFRRKSCRMVHRVDGPISVYRSRDDGTDGRIHSVNLEFADATVFQSNYSLNKHLELGMQFRNPVVVRNTVSSAIFNSKGRITFDRNRRIKILAASWSDNANKGAAVYKWLEDALDWDRYEFTFVGRSPLPFSRIRTVEPLPSNAVAEIMRQQDIFISASRFESCPNVILEALACGLPVIFHNSGGTPEVVGEGGLGFSEKEEIPALLDRLVADYEKRSGRIEIPPMHDVVSRYLHAMGLDQAMK